MTIQERFLIEQHREADLARERRDRIRLGQAAEQADQDLRLQVEYATYRAGFLDPRD